MRFKPHGLKNFHGYIMMKVLMLPDVTYVIDNMKNLHLTAAGIKKMHL